MHRMHPAGSHALVLANFPLATSILKTMRDAQDKLNIVTIFNP